MISRILLNSLLLSPTVTIATFVVSLSTVTAEVSVPSQNQTDSSADFSQNNQLQVTSVSQLSDVQPTDWAFEALQSLVERYGCIAGYPDGSYRGQQVITRYEFAAGLNACLARINELVTSTTADLIAKEDLAILQKLQEEFATELAQIRSRINVLEARTDALQTTQFSTTTKLTGEAIFAMAGVFGSDAADRDRNPNNNLDLQDHIILGNRLRLNLDSSFTGKDLLRIRLQARNVTEFQGGVTGTRMTRLGFDGNEDNKVGLDDLYYYFPIGNKVKVTLVAVEGKLNDFVPTFNPLESSGSGSISRFGRFNPIYRVSDGTGVGINYEFSKSTNLSLAYLASDARDSTDKNGLFNGNYGALAQFSFKPIKNLDMGLTYVHSYYAGGGNSGVNLTGNTGSANARRPFGNVATSADSFGLQTSFRISPKFILSGWVGYSFVESEVSRDRADIFNYAVTLALRDLGGKGHLAGIVIGMPPKVIESSQVSDRGTSLHIEGFYRLKITDNISMTPGLFVITNPEHNNNNSSIFVGVIRTTFKF
ncbi:MULTISPECIES: iron uptake porin [Nostocales]|uniref:Iron uptake porin n=3 Tax=Nostocales TaxID=1161 RepID=A0A0C1NE24_9CYAN|nr:iron uptake porin [Tolypothrix bouteillei]KAF3888004.1 iron uptake porin [Tolypothrix bouteillei VB521301]